jgi:hypothetical protein
MVSSCLLLNFSEFPPVKVYKIYKLITLKYGLIFFSVLLIEDLLSLIASLIFIPVLAIFDIF